MNFLHARLVGYGVLLGTAGIRILTSEDAKKVYTHLTAAGMRCAVEVMKTAQTISETCGDIAADARALNEKRAQEREARMIEDARAVLQRAETKSE